MTRRTRPLDEPPGRDPGGRAEVPPGTYDVTLYRIDWECMRRERPRPYHGAQEVVLLTPVSSLDRASRGPVVLPFPEALEQPWRGAHEVSDRAAICQLYCLYYWEPLRLNLDRSAAAPLGLRPGALLRVVVERFTVISVYAGDDPVGREEDLFAQVGLPRLDALRGRHSVVAVAGWRPLIYRRDTPGIELLTLHRYEGRKPYPVKLQGIWKACVLTLLDEA